MKEHPIIFGTESVRAILDGRKTQTRRVLKPLTKCAIISADISSSPQANRPDGAVLRYILCHRNISF